MAAAGTEDGVVGTAGAAATRDRAAGVAVRVRGTVERAEACTAAETVEDVEELELERR
jgi:hypothetical protein